MQDEIRQTVRLPADAVAFLDEVAKGNFTSRNAEIVRSIRERMQAATGEGLVSQAPAAADHTAALQGGSISTNG